MSLFETDRLTIRPLSLQDAPFILELLNEPSFIQNIADKGVRDLDGARNYLATGPMASYERFGFGLWLVERRLDGEPLGICGLIQREGLQDPDIGFAFLERHWSKGYAVEAAKATLEYGFEKLGMKRIVAITALHNQASGKVLERIGLRFEGLISLPQYGGQNKLYGLG
jgi:[ribosomal protein S5]-alanine N-acetyltransferase